MYNILIIYSRNLGKPVRLWPAESTGGIQMHSRFYLPWMHWLLEMINRARTSRFPPLEQRANVLHQQIIVVMYLDREQTMRWLRIVIPIIWSVIGDYWMVLSTLMNQIKFMALHICSLFCIVYVHVLLSHLGIII